MTPAEMMLAALREARGALTPARLADVAGLPLLEALDIATSLPGVIVEGAGYRLVERVA